MRLPTIGGMWPGWIAATNTSHDTEQPQMSERTPSPGGLQHQEPARARSQSTSSLGRQIFNNLVRRERRGSSGSPSSRDQEAGNSSGAESPRTPRFHLGMPVLPSIRLQLPHLTRTGTTGPDGTGSRPPTAAANQPPRFPPGQSQPAVPDVAPEPPRVTVTPAAQDESRTSGDTLTNEPRGSGYPDARARGAIVGDVDGSARTEEEERPRRFMGCFPRIRSRRVKSQIGRCLGSALLLII
ncbi:hypothetical protein IMZ48_43745, partial [Candidatus Bathyarchaeota archaeon]|nr:hypothetical protein [Candidatus Bathyarchaeota archaeon]